VSPGELIPGGVVAIPLYFGDGFLHVVKGELDRVADKFQRRIVVAGDGAICCIGLIDTIKIFAPGMEVIDAFFIADPQEDKKTAGHSHGEAEEVDGGISFVAEDGPPGDLKVVS
jgi:hypothetical protein